jgi:hypothetical protein
LLFYLWALLTDESRVLFVYEGNMKKLLVILIVGFVVATGASYFGMQWKVRKSIDEFFDTMFFVDATYDKASIDFNGRLVLNDIELFIPTTQLTLSIGSVSVATGGFWETLQLEKNLEQGKLPDSLKLSISSFSMDIDSKFIETIDAAYSPGLTAQLLALGCGRHISLGPQEYFDMGMRNLTFDLSMGYEFDLPSDEFVSTIDFYLDGVSHLVLDQTLIGLSGIMQDVKSVMTGFDPLSVTTIDTGIQYVDLGFNAKKLDYCSTASGMEEQAWLELNRSMFAAALDEFEFESEFNVIKVYSDLLDERSRVSVNLRPLPNFNMSDLEFYDISQLIELLDLTVVLNNEEVEIGAVKWDQEKFKRLNLSQIRKDFRVGPKAEAGEAEVEVSSNEQVRILKEVPVSELNKHLHRTVQIERKDGKVFSGELMSISASDIVVRTRLRSGYTDLPLSVQDIKVAKLYPE